MPANVTADEKTEYQVDTARERARTDRHYAGSFAKFGAGTLALSFLDGFTFDIGTCDLIGFDSRFVQLGNYAFRGLDGDFAANVLCTADGAELSIEAIPEPETARLFSWHRARPVHTHDRMEAADDIEVCDDVLDAASGQAKRDQTGRGVDTGLKDRWDIRLDEHPAWANARQQLNEAVLVGLRRYLRTSNSRMANRSIEQCCGRSCLNDGFDGGETGFLHQRRIVRPKTGPLLIASAAFTHTHRGNPPHAADKLIATSWILSQRAEVMFAEPAR